MFSVERRTGRLVEVRMEPPFSIDDVNGMITAVRLQALASSEPFVLCALFPRLTVLTPEASEPLLTMLRRDSPRLLRAGYLLGQRYGALAMQIDRLVREAKNPGRRWFDRSADLERFLGEVLTGPEREALRSFLARPLPAAR